MSTKGGARGVFVKHVEPGKANTDAGWRPLLRVRGALPVHGAIVGHGDAARLCEWDLAMRCLRCFGGPQVVSRESASTIGRE